MTVILDTWCGRCSTSSSLGRSGPIAVPTTGTSESDRASTPAAASGSTHDELVREPALVTKPGPVLTLRGAFIMIDLALAYAEC